MAGYLSTGRTLLRKNGLRWLFLFASAELFRRLTRRVDRRLADFERRHNLPGFYSADIARLVWTDYDWSKHGEEWTSSPQWRDSLIAEVLRPNIPAGGDVLEIGPGGGRWSVELQQRARRLMLVDISTVCLDLCRTRFRDAQNVEFALGDGRGLAVAPPASFDRIWSFDVFVHIGPADIANYLADFRRVLRPGARAIIHHAADGGAKGSWRSPMTAHQFAELAAEKGLKVIRQFDTWTHDGVSYDVAGTGDAITILENP